MNHSGFDLLALRSGKPILSLIFGEVLFSWTCLAEALFFRFACV